MNAVYYSSPKQFEVKEVPIPEPSDEEVLLKVSYCGLCGTDCHIHDGEFIAKFPLIPGHEVVGTIVRLGSAVPGDKFKIGDLCVADNGSSCDKCFFCRRGKSLLCEDFRSKGVTMDGGFAEYVTFNHAKLYRTTLPPQSATLVEPTACAIHGADRVRLNVGDEVLICGAGPTGLILAQLLRLNGAQRLVVAAPKGPKTEVAKKLGVADSIIELSRDPSDASKQWDLLKTENPYGFDVVVEATGSPALAQSALSFVRRGGTLLVYGVYDEKARVEWSPGRIFGDEITIIGSFAQTHCFPRAVQYLESGKIKTEGMITDVFKLADYQAALDRIKSKGAVKVIIDAQG
ncbi:NADP+-dependent D-mannitol dehydrogenase [Pterulicium gracile]|uniref:NADP+-dependent D-mannitol dehydrogenase n=1 Tax=Pterulicium gracile TaxID=1884261 RepID=A0A5C3QHU1_9AGAR|nr:NADP+-dependent D-mannitol dehydrogenase [Pterula gracilis]